MAFYDLPSVQMKRTAGFGYGHKYDFTKDFVQRAPAPNAYSLKSEFSGSAEAKARGISFGLGREVIKKDKKKNYLFIFIFFSKGFKNWRYFR